MTPQSSPLVYLPFNSLQNVAQAYFPSLNFHHFSPVTPDFFLVSPYSFSTEYSSLHLFPKSHCHPRLAKHHAPISCFWKPHLPQQCKNFLFYDCYTFTQMISLIRGDLSLCPSPSLHPQCSAQCLVERKPSILFWANGWLEVESLCKKSQPYISKENGYYYEHNTYCVVIRSRPE